MPRTFLVSLCAAFLCACGPTDSGLSVEEIPSPSGPGSGEPFLSTTEDGVVLSWLQVHPDGGHGLWIAQLGDDGWSVPALVVRREDFFVNWADFPSVLRTGDGSLWAHWLQRGGAGSYDYGVRVSHSVDEGRTWSEPWTPHEDGTATEHGFVSLFPFGDGIGVTWLDGREYQMGVDGGPPPEEMTVRFRSITAQGVPGPEVLLDGRACDCCQTDVAVAAAGPVAVYRDRTDDEIRDIYVTRWEDGVWTEGIPVHEDGWEIGGCPVNGPAVAARGDTVVVAWFTAARDTARVNAAFSFDGGASFGDPVRVDDGDPVGRVDVRLHPGGGALVTWLERTGGESAEVRARTVASRGTMRSSQTISVSAAARGSGFPRTAFDGRGDVIVAWTDFRGDGSAVRVARIRREGS